MQLIPPEEIPIGENSNALAGNDAADSGGNGGIDKVGIAVELCWHSSTSQPSDSSRPSRIPRRRARDAAMITVTDMGVVAGNFDLFLVSR